ncbi:hypothetical protein M378DRAFT_161902 [Amanita muscaria Koide BX008]|uniref:Uncharacterized protein n=1 Tax=Amanita muscaria (strain Koide BX008) TaxID=946122 RepID=A0A0C2WV20_AMAMK|nr:hypothetical protein M378DRAFT_161902 [Amanita muscaria Koide BX008]
MDTISWHISVSPRSCALPPMKSPTSDRRVIVKLIAKKDEVHQPLTRKAIFEI